MPAPAHDQLLEGLQSRPERMRLDNGLALAVSSRPGFAKAAISVRVAAGSHDEPAEYPGLAHFLEHLLFLGSEGYAVEQGLMAFVQACGGQVNASTQARHTDYFCEVPADRLDEALARLLDMLANPLLDPAAQLREREVVHAEFLARGQDADTLVTTALGQALPTAHRCAAFVAGNRETLEVASGDFQQALVDFHRCHYRAAQLSLVLVGPQSTEALQALACQQAGRLPGLPGHAPAVPEPLLPLRVPQLRMTLAGAAPGLHLGFAIELPASLPGDALDQALDYLQTWLADESAGGLSATLRQARLCSGLQVRVVYRYAAQALLLLSFADVEEAAAERLAIAAAVDDWLGFFALQADRVELRERHRLMLAHRLAALSPLALARHWQQGSAPIQGLGADGRAAVQTVLAQMRSAGRSIQLCSSPRGMAPWPSEGFPLCMQPEALIGASSRTWAWQLPAPNPFLQPATRQSPALGVAAHLHWLAPADTAAGLGQAALFMRCCLAQALAADQLLGHAQARLAELQRQAAQAGVTLQASAEAGALQLSLEGAAGVLPRVLWHSLQRLFDSGDVAMLPGSAPSAGAEMPIRQLMRRLPELFAPLPDAPSRIAPEQLPGQLRQARLEVLGAGFDAAAQGQVAAMFDRVAPLSSDGSATCGRPGRHWRDAGFRGQESALLLFCPQPTDDGRCEAGWRLLAHLIQGPFYRRLRSELQLGYALFCGYRQVGGRRGILFAVQSPQASAQQVLAHIEAFLQTQGERLAILGDEARQLAVDELGGQLPGQGGSPVELADQHWQQHLAGLPSGHDAAVRAALAEIGRDDLLRLHRSLCRAEAGWHLLANAECPAAGWSSAG